MLGETRFQRYIQDSARISYDDGALCVSVPTAFHRDRLDRRFGDELTLAAREAFGNPSVHIRWQIEPAAFDARLGDVRDDAPTVPERTDRAAEGENDGGSLGADGPAPIARRRHNPTPRYADPLAPIPHPGLAHAPNVRRSIPGERFHRLEDFVVGPSNRMAYEAARRVAEDENAIFGVLSLYGVCGVGKTHLLQGITRRFAERRPGARIKYTTTERFANEYIALVRDGKADEFRRRYRPLDLLCLDDVHFLSGKKATQSEFLHTFEALELSGARVVIASDEHPKMIRDLHASIVSRVSSGIIVEVETPDRETRVRLVRTLGERRGLVFEAGAAEEVAGACRGSVRDIEGAVTRVEACASLLGAGRDGRITPGIARQVLSTDRSRMPVRPIRLGEILEAVCSVVRVDASEVLGPGRHKRIVLARSLAARLARDLTNHSFPEIARAMNRRNHSTIVTASQRIERQIEGGATVRDEPSLREVRIADLYDQARGRLLGRAG